jgi:hypothetical protein
VSSCGMECEEGGNTSGFVWDGMWKEGAPVGSCGMECGRREHQWVRVGRNVEGGSTSGFVWDGMHDGARKLS